MNLKCETILDFYTHKKKKIFCQIKVQPSKSHKIKHTCRSLTQEQWNAFDKELERLLDGMISSEEGDNKLLGKFMIEPRIEVKVQKSKLSLKYLFKCLATSGDNENDFWGRIDDIKDVAYALECLLDLEHESIINPEEIQEYEPQLDTSPDGKITTALIYEPYTPSKRKYCKDGIATINSAGTQLLNYNEDTYSPMPLFETSTTEALNEIIPQYKPAPIKGNRNRKNSANEKSVDIKNYVFVPKLKEEYIPEIQKIPRFDIPAYIPTPINSALKTFYEKPNVNFENKYLRKRSKTIDAIPKDLSANMFCKQKSAHSVTQSEEHLDDKITKYKPVQKSNTYVSREIDEKNCTNEFVFETADEAASAQKNRPLRSKKNNRRLKQTDNNLKTQELNEDINSDERTVEIDDLRDILPGSYNKKCRKRCKTLDSIPREFAMGSDKIKLSIVLEENGITKTTNTESSKLKEKQIELNQKNSVENGKEKKLDKYPAPLSEDRNISEQLKKQKTKKETYLNECDNDFEDKKNVDRNKNINMSTSPATDGSSPKTVKNTKQPKESFPLRRSDRSPSKPIRFIEEIGIDTSLNRHKKRKKLSPKNKELFGTDDDDDDDDYFENNSDSNNNGNKTRSSALSETPISIKPLLSSSPSAKKKRKRDRNSDCEQEKRDISKWLSKNKDSALKLEATISKGSKKTTRSKSPSIKSSKTSKHSTESTKAKGIQPESTIPTPGNFDMPSKEELEKIRNKTKLTQKENEKLKAELDKIKAPPPKEVKHLSLQNMSLNDILNTFPHHKNELDEIYQKYYKRDYIKGHDGINHCFVIQLLQQNVQLKMLEKLTDVYSNRNNTTQATLYANALLPEWIIRVYMEKFNFTREEAITQIKAQDDYRLHMEEQNDGSFIFD